MHKVRCLELGEGDAMVMHNYFLKMQVDNSNFFHMIDFDEDNQVTNIFWAFKEFGDVHYI